MITTLLLTILYFFIMIICALLPTWQIWPADFLNAVGYFFEHIAGLNFIFPIDSFFEVFSFFISFEVLYLTAKLIMKVFNFARGTGSGLDL